jgi:hypothetical protein
MRIIDPSVALPSSELISTVLFWSLCARFCFFSNSPIFFFSFSFFFQISFLICYRASS